MSKPLKDLHLNFLISHLLTQSLSHVQLFATPWNAAHQAPLSMGFSGQEYWSELPFPFPGDLPNPVIESVSLASPALAGRFIITEPPGEPRSLLRICWVHLGYVQDVMRDYRHGSDFLFWRTW